MFIYRSRFLTRGEVWFDDEPDAAPVDWIYYRQRPKPVARARPKYTVLVGLEQGPAQLLSRMSERTVRKIDAAEKQDQTRWERCEATDPKLMDAVEQMWNETAPARKVAPLDRVWLAKLIEAGALEITATKDPAGNVLTYHLTYVGKERAQDLIVVSPDSPRPNLALRNRIHRANCLGHWQTMLALKARGLRRYDFGGWYPGATNIQFLGMNAFKESFGGEVVREFECEEIRTLKGWLVLAAARLLQRTPALQPAPDALAGARPDSKTKANTYATPKNSDVSPAF